MYIIMFFLQYNALFFLKLYIYTAFPPAFPLTFPFFEGLFRIVSVSETSYRFPVSCNLVLTKNVQTQSEHNLKESQLVQEEESFIQKVFPLR
jgi:hypothetical protein